MSPFGARAQGVTTLPFANGERPLVRYPGKRPLIQLTARPPQLETPFSVFDEGVITPNDAFFVRYHLSDIPLSIDPEAFRLEVKGKVDRRFRCLWPTLKPASSRSNSSPSTNARETAADLSSLASRAANLAMARWATPAGAAFR